MKINLKQLILNYVPKEEFPEFCEWAWGTDFESIDFKSARTLISKWNENHNIQKDSIGSSSLSEDMKEIVQRWNES